MSILRIKKKALKKKILILLIILLLLLTIWVIPSIIVSKKDTFTLEKAIDDYEEKSTRLSLIKYNIGDLYQVLLVENEQKNYILEMDNNITYANTFSFNVKIENYDENSNYKVDIWLNENLVMQKNISSSQEKIDLQLEEEGKYTLQIDFYKNNEETNSEITNIYYIEPYKKQFLDELSNNSITAHYRAGNYENYNKSIPILSTLGVQLIRVDFFYAYIYKNNAYDFTRYDEWIEILKEKCPNIKIVAIIQPASAFTGIDRKINSDKEIERYIEFCKEVATHYPEITYFEILNEPNFIYLTDEDLYWYRTMLEMVSITIKEFNPDIKIISGTVSAGTQDTSTYLSSKIFFDKMYSNTIYKLSETFAYNAYTSLPLKISTHKNQFNDFGGFLKQYITEYGFSTYNGRTEEEQAIEIIEQTNCLKEYGVYYSNIYNLWDTGKDTSSQTQNYGLLRNDYTPKLSYYAMKNYYENTNGSEYIGTVNLADGLEAHVYDKDGKPKIIAWSDNTDNTITIPYEDFTASDIYGNEIENTSGTLEITTSPVYLDNISNKYFYEAISNTALEKYAEFEEKFSTELSSINGIDEKINELKNYMSAISSNTTETQDTAIKMMSEHFALGNTILNAYKNGMLDVEYVKVSSMLDMLNDIGDSYEDLLTVSATAREAYYAETQKLIDSAEKIINDNADLDIVYPTKILDFAKELDEKSEYINSLEEENDIKTGLIVSNSLHAYYLADWANEFAKIYVEKYIEENPVTVSYSNTDEFTNQDVIATLNIGSDSKVTNNNESNTYTFTKNDTFTFEYERRGQAYTLEATVSNIDKDAPKISGVENGKIYINNARPIITDEHLLSVELLFNGIETQYTDGMTLSAEGIYNITATDKAGNSTAIEMYIVEEGPDSYIVQNNYILNVRQKTTAEQFADKFNLSSEYSIIRNDTNLPNDNIIATGDVLELRNGATYTIIVAGDINCDGKVTTYDLSTLRRYILNLRKFNELESLAADINVDGQELGVKDYSRMRIEILGRY